MLLCAVLTMSKNFKYTWERYIIMIKNQDKSYKI